MTTAATLSEDTTVRRAPNAAFRELEGKLFLVGSASTTLTMLNETGTAVWQYLEQASTLGQLAWRLSKEFKVGWESALHDCQTFVETLADRDLVQLEPKDHRAADGAEQR